METTVSRAPDHRRLRTLLGLYLLLSIATLGIVVLLRDDAARVDDAVWVRTSIVAASALLMNLFAARAARGSARALLRLRLVATVVLVAIVVVLAIPGSFPVWLKIDQAVLGVVLLGAVVTAFRPVSARP